MKTPKNRSDEIMNLAYEMADAKAAHAEAVRLFSNDQGEWEDVKKTGAAWSGAERSLRVAVNRVLREAKEA